MGFVNTSNDASFVGTMTSSGTAVIEMPTSTLRSTTGATVEVVVGNGGSLDVLVVEREVVGTVVEASVGATDDAVETGAADELGATAGAEESEAHEATRSTKAPAMYRVTSCNDFALIATHHRGTVPRCRTVVLVLENYSAGAQRVVTLATLEARSLDHPRVGTEHLLLGLLADDDAEPADLLRAAGVTLIAARHKVVEALGADAGSPTSEGLPFTPRALRALERAGRFARKDQEPEVTAGHVLLGVLDVEGLACQVLRGLGVDLVYLRNSLGTTTPQDPVVLVDEQPSVETIRPQCPHCDAPLDETLTEVLVAARRDGAPTTNVSVVYCASCSTTLGVMRPEPS